MDSCRIDKIVAVCLLAVITKIGVIGVNAKPVMKKKRRIERKREKGRKGGRRIIEKTF